MNELEQKWVAALRSGKYQQDSGRLRTEKGFCCLGVLCDVVNESKWAVHDRTSESGEKDTVFRYIDTGGTEVDSYLPDSIQEQLTLTEWQCSELADLNDTGSLFSMIADVIEKGGPDEKPLTDRD